MSFDVASFFAWVYPVVPVVAAIAYFPQIYAALKARTNMESTSLATWYIWLGMGLVTLGYSIFNIGDHLLMITALVNAVLQVVFIGIVLYKRYRFSGVVLVVPSPEEIEVVSNIEPEIIEIVQQMHEEQSEIRIQAT